MPPWSDVALQIADTCPGTRVRQVSRVMTKIYDDALRPLGIQSSQMSLLVAVARFGDAGATITGLARVLAMDRTTLTRNIRPLEADGLVRVARSPDDKRASIVVLTRAGERMLEAVHPLWTKATAHIRATLGATRMDDLRASLNDTLTRLRAPDHD
ncbi:MAG TPA: MarR family winged helix-turn-helix transcriptional regulator [Kofleriaceae bacterium]|jgi:DNA-binding MarR family transcriptional regulator|nr:MarR family winged helix-turn-helix transcriptional regulator [Kofleriaceae bacterium]